MCVFEESLSVVNCVRVVSAEALCGVRRKDHDEANECSAARLLRRFSHGTKLVRVGNLKSTNSINETE